MPEPITPLPAKGGRPRKRPILSAVVDVPPGTHGVTRDGFLVPEGRGYRRSLLLLPPEAEDAE